jgi:putative tryptophan/tyrosine transport system substrate-binding protein
MKSLLASSALLVGLAAGNAQESTRIHSLAVLAVSARSPEFVREWALPELKRLGFSEEKNLKVEITVAESRNMKAATRDLVARKPDAILAVAGQAVEAARLATNAIPIVAIGTGAAFGETPANLARPVDNVTGFVILGAELDAKRLELLSEAFVGQTVVAWLVDTSNPYLEARRAAINALAAASHIDLRRIETNPPGGYAAAFATVRAIGARAAAIGSDPQHLRDIPTIAAHALESRVATICHWREMTEQGCMMSYGPSLAHINRRAGEYLARIFRGTSVKDLPIESPATFEFIVNLKTAKAIGVTLPPALIARADEVIE